MDSTGETIFLPRTGPWFPCPQFGSRGPVFYLRGNMKQSRYNEILLKLHSVTEGTACALLLECGMNADLKRVDQRSGAMWDATEEELQHLEEILDEAYHYENDARIEDDTLAFDAQGHLVQLDDNRVVVYF